MDWNAPAPETLDKPKEPLHPTGAHAALVTNAVADKTKNGKIMLRLTFKTEHGKVEGRLVYSPESDGARRMWFKQLANMQVGKAFLDGGPDPDEVALACVKAEVLIRVVHDTFQDGEFADVGFIDAGLVEKDGEVVA